MKPSTSKKDFLESIKKAGASVASMTPSVGIELMLAFYREVRASSPLAEDGDMLLYQWGTYDWGEGESYEVDITRQFIDEEHEIRQLSLTFHYPPTEVFRAVGQGNEWCRSPKELNDFRSWILSAASYTAVSNQRAARVSVELDDVC
jgi:hypothetical protein